MCHTCTPVHFGVHWCAVRPINFQPEKRDAANIINQSGIPRYRNGIRHVACDADGKQKSNWEWLNHLVTRRPASVALAEILEAALVLGCLQCLSSGSSLALSHTIRQPTASNHTHSEESAAFVLVRNGANLPMGRAIVISVPVCASGAPTLLRNKTRTTNWPWLSSHTPDEKS